MGWTDLRWGWGLGGAHRLGRARRPSGGTPATGLARQVGKLMRALLPPGVGEGTQSLVLRLLEAEGGVGAQGREQIGTNRTAWLQAPLPHVCWECGEGPQDAASGTRLLGFCSRRGPGGRNQRRVGKRASGRREAVARDLRPAHAHPTAKTRAHGVGGGGSVACESRSRKRLSKPGAGAHLLHNRSTSPRASSIPSAISKEVSQAGKTVPFSPSHTAKRGGGDPSGPVLGAPGTAPPRGSGRRCRATGAGPSTWE